MVRLLITIRLAAVLALLMGTASPAQAWKNGPPENKVTTNAADCQSPPYATHDWIADQAVNLLPREVVQEDSVKAFQSKLQGLVKERGAAGCFDWAETLSPRVPLWKHPLR